MMAAKAVAKNKAKAQAKPPPTAVESDHPVVVALLGAEENLSKELKALEKLDPLDNGGIAAFSEASFKDNMKAAAAGSYRCTVTLSSFQHRSFAHSNIIPNLGGQCNKCYDFVCM